MTLSAPKGGVLETEKTPAAPSEERTGSHGSPLLRDLAVGTLVAVFMAISPFTPVSWGPSLALGALAGAAAVGWRVWGRFRSPDTADSQRPRLRIDVPISVWLAFAALALTFATTFVWLGNSWTGNVWNNAHGVLIPPVMVWMTWSALRREEDGTPDASAWGFAFLVPGLALVALDAGLRTQQLAAAGLVLVLVGLALLLLGTRRTRLLTVPLLLGLFMIPISNTLASHIFLKQITATAAGSLIGLMGVPVIREDTLLVLSKGSFLVADACSGFATLYASVGVSVVLAAYARSWPRRILIFVAAWPLAIACNITRVIILVVLANYYGLGLLDTPFHAASGVATFWAALVLLIMLSDREGLRKAAA